MISSTLLSGDFWRAREGEREMAGETYETDVVPGGNEVNTEGWSVPEKKERNMNDKKGYRVG